MFNSYVLNAALFHCNLNIHVYCKRHRPIPQAKYILQPHSSWMTLHQLLILTIVSITSLTNYNLWSLFIISYMSIRNGGL